MMINQSPALLRPNKALTTVRGRLNALAVAIDALAAELQETAAQRRRTKAGSWEEIEARAEAFCKYRVNNYPVSACYAHAVRDTGCDEKSIQIARKLVAEVPDDLANLVRRKVIAVTTLRELLQQSAKASGTWLPGAVHGEIVETRQALKNGLIVAPRAPEEAEITLSIIKEYRAYKAGQQAEAFRMTRSAAPTRSHSPRLDPIV